MVNLLCTVRNCGLPLVREERVYRCANHHSFDVARSGYVNLLQPQDRKSKSPGDSSEAVLARRRFFEAGPVRPLVDAIVQALPLRGALLDAGCGEGHHLDAFRRAYGVEAWGVDISVPAIELAAKTYRECGWVVANADRLLPFADGSFDAVTSITARMNPHEFHRVLVDRGALLVVLPGAADLIELRSAILGEGLERDRTDRTVAAFAPLFTLEGRQSIAHTATLDRASMLDVMSSSYRGLRTREREKLEALEPMPVTLARDLLLFRAETRG
ncbi:MAG TPA: methyltransferase domain-containing protein [Thermoanaerobaculia bacterium]|nr:methyltransferase domain-containing protein [Thermoanaerobaculia bacterium]